MNDKVVLAAVAGFIAAWVIQWIIDVWFYRPCLVTQSKDAVTPLLSAPSGAAVDSDEVERLKKELALRDDEIRRLKKQQAPKSTDGSQDDLELIDGIGPVFEAKLYEAGIKTFAQLSTQDPETLRSIIKPQKWQKIEPEKWIAEAATRAQGA